METKKQCSICGEEKVLNDFNKRNSRKIGYSSACKECLKKKRMIKINEAIEKGETVYSMLSQEKKNILNEQARKRYRINKKKGISKHQKYLATLTEEEFKIFKDKRKKIGQKYYEKNKDIINKKARERSASGELTLKKYNLTMSQYNKILEEQKKVCAICGKEENTRIKQSLPLFIDHNHTSGKVRGLLCHKCNIMVGMALDDKQILLNGINYLSKYEK